MKEQEIEDLSEIFKALAHPLRVKITAGLLKKDDCNVSTMVERLGVPQPTVSRHLNILKTSGVIEGFRHGNQICYRIVNDRVRDIFKAAVITPSK